MINSLPPEFLQNLVWPGVRLMLTLFARFKIQGAEHLKDIRGPVIFAGNHASEIDVVLVPAAFPFLSRFIPMFYVAKKREFYEKKGLVALLYGGAFFKLWGAYPVREGLRDYKSSLNLHVDILKQGKSILIFPEGGISPDGSIQPARGGVAYLAYAAKVPVVPTVIVGTRNFSWGRFILGWYRFSVTFGKPIMSETLFSEGIEPSVDDYKRAAERIMDEVRRLKG
ncbi:1-acyl-sn-glycerol-3-phosphate acyltransferase [Candidatus Parcubacteria bacterium]|nr:1-acyl-sn-glycerol-3-phosphate acyltransferase [Candidatus Parcubacteria bacterium]